MSLDNAKFEDISNVIGEKSDLKQIIEVQVKNSYFELSRTFIDKENLRIIEIIKDISDVKNKEAELVLKSVALREAHHRVKNSLQTANLHYLEVKVEDAKVMKLRNIYKRV